jgi:thiosulfate/3-mercaptopyruvate sulfurtransferase
MRKNGQVNSPLVSCAALVESLAGPTVPVLLDVRWRLGGPPGRLDYDRAHLPGAVYLDLDTDLAAPPGPGGRHPLPDPIDLQRVLRAAGVRPGAPVVAYDDDNGSVAARAWWLLRWAGHDKVTVLDGGFKAWTAQGLPVTAEVPLLAPGDIVVRPGAMPVVDATGAAELARTGVLIDARAPERYRGEVEPIDPRAGHVPGAINAPFAGHVTADGYWRPAGELAERFAAIGVTAGAGSAAVDETAGPVAGDPGAADRASAGVDEGGAAHADVGAGAAGAADVGVAGSGTAAAGGAAVHADRAAADSASVEQESTAAGGAPAAADAAGAGTEGAVGLADAASAGVGTEGGAGTAEVGAADSGIAAAGGARIGAYCGSGVTATSVLLALEVAGVTSPDNPGVLYAGSWSNWSADPDRPVATGSEPQQRERQ